MRKSIILNGKSVPVFHAEAGKFYPSKRIDYPKDVVVTVPGMWDRDYLLLTDEYAIEIVVEVTEGDDASGVPDSDPRRMWDSANLFHWEKQTSVGKIKAITTLPTRIEFEAGAEYPISIIIRDLTKDERMLVVSAAQLRHMQEGASAAVKSSPMADWMNREETQKYCGFSKSTLTNWMKRDWIRFHKQGKVVRFNRAEVDEDLKKLGKRSS
jgi:hypothetical protein